MGTSALCQCPCTSDLVRVFQPPEWGDEGRDVTRSTNPGSGSWYRWSMSALEAFPDVRLRNKYLQGNVCKVKMKKN